MRYYAYATALLLAVLIALPTVSANHTSIDISRVLKYGPQLNNILVLQTAFGTTQPMLDNMALGQVDIGEWELSRAQVDTISATYINVDVDGNGLMDDCRDTLTGATFAAKASPSAPNKVRGAICLQAVNQFGMRVLDINNLRPLGSNVHFRRAIAHLNDIARFVTDDCGGLCSDMGGIPLPNPAMSDWRNAAAAAAFPKFDPAAAWAELQAGGFIDVDGDGVLEYDLNGDGTTAADEEPTIQHYGRLDLERSRYGQRIKNKYAFDNPGSDANNIRALFGAGFRYNYQEVTFATVFRDIFDPDCAGRKHDLYQGGWSTGIDPTTLFFLYHSQFDGPGLPNYNCVRDPSLDAALDNLLFATDGAQALTNALAAQTLWSSNVYNVGLWSAAAPIPYRAQVRDVVNAKGIGGYSTDSWLTVNFRGTGVPRDPLTGWTGVENAINPWESLNVVYNSDFWGDNILDLVYETPININPYKPTILGNEGLMPWLVKGWTLGTYTGTTPHGTACPVASCDVITYNLDSKHPVLFHDGSQMTADDIAFSIEYGRDSIRYGGWQGQGVFDVIDTLVPNAYQVSIYFDSRSFFHLINSAINIYPKNLWCPTWPNMADPSCVPFASPPAPLETAPTSPVQGDVTGQVGTGPFRLVDADLAGGTTRVQRFADYHQSSKNYDSFHFSGNVNGMSPDYVDHLVSAHGRTATYSILTDNSNKIDVLDLVSIGGNFNRQASAAPKADLNEDGVINILDLVRVGGNMFKDWDHGDWTTFPAPAGHPITYP